MLFPSLFGTVQLPDPESDYRNPLRPPGPRVRRPVPRPAR